MLANASKHKAMSYGRMRKKRAAIAEEEKAREEEGKPRRGRKPKEPSDEPKDKAQRNFTDPDSRIMKDGATKSFEQCYNAQAAVDAGSQVIVAAGRKVIVVLFDLPRARSFV